MTTIPTLRVPLRRSPTGDMAQVTARWRLPVSDRAAAGVLVALTLAMHLMNIAGWPAFFDDEGTYLSQALAVYDGSLSPYTYWYDHPPFGWLQLAALQWLPNLVVSPDIVAGRVTMVGFSAAAVAGIYRIGPRLGLTRTASFAAGLLWCLSPLVVFESRQVFLDVIAVPWIIWAFYFALSPRRHLGHYLLSGALLGGAVLTKETTILFAPAVFCALWTGAFRSTRAFCVAAFLMSITTFGSAYVLYALLKGELFPGPGHVSLLDALLFQTADRQGSGFILAPGTGAHGLLLQWLGFDRVLLIGGLVGMLACLARRQQRALGLALLVPVLVALRPNGYLPFMYVTTLLPFLALGCAVVGTQVVVLARRSAARLGNGRGPSRQNTVIAGVGATVVALSVLAATWAPGLARATTSHENSTHDAVTRWVGSNIPRSDRVLVDNVYWLDLRDMGWRDPWRNVWFTKLDLDPIAARLNLAHGYHDLDYLIWTRTLAGADAADMPTVAAAYRSSVVVQTFGQPTSPDYVEIRRVVPGR